MNRTNVGSKMTSDPADSSGMSVPHCPWKAPKAPAIVGAYQALQEAGIEVGREVSVVSFDDEPVAAWLRPELTTIALPHYELGHKAVEVLLGHLAADGPVATVHRVHMPLRRRDSIRSVEASP
jgi:DNA-binding LacI/PurR family transcriptional regulator